MKTHQRNRNQLSSVRAKYDKSTGLVHLNVPLSVKAESIDAASRTFEGLAATWDEDLGQDVIHKGAFDESITEWKGSGEAMPLLNSHDHFNIFSALGQAVSMKETKEGLWTKWEVLDGEDGDKVLQRLRPSPTTKRAIIGKMSIGFIPLKFDFEQPEGTESFWDRIRHITKASLKEVSLVLFPMNPNASIDASTVKMWLKAASQTDGRTLNPLARTELRRLNTVIGNLLKKQRPEDDSELDESEDEQDQSSTRRSSASKGGRRSTDHKTDDVSDDVTDEAEDELDEVDNEDHGDGSDDSSTDDSDDAGDEDETDETYESVPDSTKGKKDKKKDEVVEPEPKTYLFGEALQHRLKALNLGKKISEAREHTS